MRRFLSSRLLSSRRNQSSNRNNSNDDNNNVSSAASSDRRGGSSATRVTNERKRQKQQQQHDEMSNSQEDQHDIVSDLERVEQQLHRSSPAGSVSSRMTTSEAAAATQETPRTGPEGSFSVIRHDPSSPSSSSNSNNGGRAVFESISSALTSIRRRLTHSNNTSNNNDSSTSAPAAATSPGTTVGVSTTELMERLESAERAHNHHIPLGFLHQEMERRSQSTIALPNETLSSSNTSRKTAGNVSSQEESQQGSVGLAKRDNSEDGNSSDSVHSNPDRPRRTSTLMASRMRDDALQRPAVDRQLHSLGGVEVVLLSTLPEDEEAEEVEGGIQIQNDRVLVRDEGGVTLEDDARRAPSRKVESATSAEEPLNHTNNNDMTLLMTDKSRARLDESSNSAIQLLGSHHQVSSSLVSAESPERTEPVTSDDAGPKFPSSKTCVYSWGSEGSHSLHDNDTVRTPADSKVVDGRVARHTLLQVGMGPRHGAAVTATGQVLICGENSYGQVDPSDPSSSVISKPRLFEFPSSMTRITQISCGRSHTAAVTASGTVLTWGDNAFGQLGQRKQPSTSAYSIPKVMVGVSRAAQVACGHDFTTVLTTRMELFVCGSQDVVTWTNSGDNNNNKQNEPPLPTTVPSLEGLPLVKVVAGARHVVVLTAFGTAYAWGSNEEGCCSRAFPKCIHTPVPIIFTTDNMDTETEHNDILSPFPHWSRKGCDDRLALDPSVAIQDAACGEAFTVLLTKTGQVYVCGSNGQGQLGMETPCVLTSTLLSAVDGKGITAVAAGQCQSLLLSENGDVWSMGAGEKLHVVLKDKGIRHVFAGGKEVVAISPANLPRAVPGGRRIEREFSLQKGSDDGVDEMVIAGSNDGDVFLVETLMAQEDQGRLLKRIHAFFSSPTIWNSLFLDPSECDDLYQQLLSRSDTDVDTSATVAIAKAMQEAMLRGLENLRSARHLYPESVRFLLLFLQCPLFLDNKVGDEQSGFEFDARGELSLSLCESFLNLPFEGYRAIQQWAASVYGPKYFSKFLVRPLIAMLERGVADGGGAKSRSVTGVVTLLRWFHGTWERNPSLGTAEDFHSEAIGKMDPEVLYEDLKMWKDRGKRSGTFFLSAHPFLLSPRTKRTLLMIENQVEMLRAATSNLKWDRDNHQFVFDPYFVLAIDRQNLLPQALQRIMEASHTELRKSLKIVFKGEDAVDAGGVTKEFFQLLSHQLFDMNTGMWSSQFGDTVTWFNGDCTWNDDGYYLVGVLTGLAIYNAVILDVHFPRAVYRKLLGHTLGLEDMVDEETKKGLEQLLAYEGDDVEDIFCLSFEHTWMDLGMERRVELKPGGADIPVTSQNKEEYVMLYVKWLLVDSIQAQYENFERGVMQVLESSSLDLLEPDEMELLLVGTPELDLDAWEKNTSYEGFEADSAVIQNFWKFVRNSDRETHLRLLKFTTGASRAPIGGLGAMPFKIQRAGGDSMQLPTSHTCFNILILPDYGESYEKLERLLGRAILECEGFGLQ